MCKLAVENYCRYGENNKSDICDSCIVECLMPCERRVYTQVRLHGLCVCSSYVLAKMVPCTITVSTESELNVEHL